MSDTTQLSSSPGPATRKLLRAESALRQRVEFESFVYRLQNHFVNLPASELDWGINEALAAMRSEEHTSELQSRENLVCRLLLEKKNTQRASTSGTTGGRTRGCSPPRTSGPRSASRSAHITNSRLGTRGTWLPGQSTHASRTLPL